MREPVVLKVGSSHIRVTSVSLGEGSFPEVWLIDNRWNPRLSCKSTDLIPLTDVSDVYNVSTGQELREFIICLWQVYFSSHSREVNVKVRESQIQTFCFWYHDSLTSVSSPPYQVFSIYFILFLTNILQLLYRDQTWKPGSRGSMELWKELCLYWRYVWSFFSIKIYYWFMNVSC